MRESSFLFLLPTTSSTEFSFGRRILKGKVWKRAGTPLVISFILSYVFNTHGGHLLPPLSQGCRLAP